MACRVDSLWVEPFDSISFPLASGDAGVWTAGGAGGKRGLSECVRVVAWPMTIIYVYTTTCLWQALEFVAITICGMEIGVWQHAYAGRLIHDD